MVPETLAALVPETLAGLGRRPDDDGQAIERRGAVQSGEMIPLLKRHAIQVLREAGHELADIAARVGVGERTCCRAA